MLRICKLVLTTIFLASVVSCSNAQKNQQLSPVEFSKATSTAGATILDVRTADEFKEAHIPNAVNIDWYDESFKEKISQLDKQKPVYVYCRSGGRSEEAAAQLRSSGFAEVYELDGGIVKWQKAKLPVK